MPLTFRTLLDFVDTATHPQALHPVLERFTRAHGFRHYAYLSLQTSGTRYLGDYPPRWEGQYLGERLDRLDPVIARARSCSGAFWWSVADWAKIGDRRLKLFASDALGHGVGYGLSISARASFDTQLVLSFAGAEHVQPMPEKEIADAVPLLMGFHYRLSTMLGLSSGPGFKPLSSRETLCLAWAARGKTAPETAAITGLSPRTVQHYLDAAREKLGAVTISQLVAISKDLKLI